MTEILKNDQNVKVQNETEPQVQNKHHSALSKLLAAGLFIVLALVSFLLWQTTETSTTGTQRSVNQPVNGTAAADSDSSYCISNTKRHNLQEALAQPREVCALRLTPEDSITFLKERSREFIHLESLYLNKNDANIPPEIGAIPSLKVFNFHHTHNTKFPPEIAKLQKLHTMYLSKTDITELPPEVGSLSSLTQLTIVYNTQPVHLPPEIGKLTNLQIITLRENPAVSLPPTLTNNLNLTSLELSYNNLKEIPAVVYQLTGLQTLTLSINNITTVSADIKNLKTLKALRVDKNALTHFPPIGALQELETLNLSDNQLSQLPEGIETLKQLKYLNVSGNTIKKSDMEALKKVFPHAHIVY